MVSKKIKRTEKPDLTLKDYFLAEEKPVGFDRVPTEEVKREERTREEIERFIIEELGIDIQTNVDDAVRRKDASDFYEEGFTLNVGMIKTLPPELLDIFIDEMEEACAEGQIDAILGVLDAWVFSAEVHRSRSLSYRLMEIIRRSQEA